MPVDPSHTMSQDLLIDQASLDGFCQVTEALNSLASSADSDARGAVFTKREVVDFMLDLAGYTADRPLHQMRLLEPSSGGGEFLLAAAERLLKAYEVAGRIGDLAPCIRAVELHRSTHADGQIRLDKLLQNFDMPQEERSRLLSSWLICGDFLLQPMPGQFDFIVGNPPYVRQELIPAPLLAQYRRLYRTLYDRADLYVPFFERCLSLLSPHGQLVFICSDRWIKNKYGGPLRAMVAESFHLRAYVDMVNTAAFEADVTAYTAITWIERAQPGPTLFASSPSLDPSTLSRLATLLRDGAQDPKLGVSAIGQISSGGTPWYLGSSEKLHVLRRLEEAFPTLEQAGCKVGIGVATGADKAFIGPMGSLDVEPSRKLPLVTTKDIANGTVRWTGLGVVNPFENDGTLVDLTEYPKLQSYLERHREQIAGRHVAQKSQSNWYRTIDRITPSLAKQRKLLIPDIKGSAHIVFEDGELYPHHNLYFVTSQEWDLRALQAVLLSGIAKQFIVAYSTSMRGGFLRFQAQYLRRIRIPYWRDVPQDIRARLIDAAISLDVAECDAVACELYGFDPADAVAFLRS